MRLQISKTKNASSFYVVESTYDKNGKRSNKIVEKLGTLAELQKIHDDPVAWAKEYVAELTEKKKNENVKVRIDYNPSARMDREKNTLYNGGYLFIQSLYHKYGLDKICKFISKKYEFEYDLNSILSRLIYGRILSPSSKLSTMEYSKTLLEKPNFELHQIYRALEVLAKESDNIQAQLYQNSKAVSSRNDSILYYDCTNFFFEIEEESGLRQYGVSKEHRPNPIVEMGMFIDGDGVPLAFCINPGNTNEQQTLRPLEQQIIRDFGKSKFVICTDAGLSSTANRKFNAIQNRAFITVQSIKKMPDYQKAWALGNNGWKLQGSNETYTLDYIKDNRNLYEEKTFYKEDFFNDNGIEQRYIVTFSLKYMDYLRNVRERQIQRAQKTIDLGLDKKNSQNDPDRFVGQLYFDDNGEIVERHKLFLNEDKIRSEEVYDGFYCVATNLFDSADAILKVNAKRWEIEESFRIMKSEFKSRPVFLSRDDRIKAHFLTCFLSLFIFRNFEKVLNSQFTASELIKTLKQMLFQEVPRDGYIPVYTRNDITDLIHSSFGIYTDYQFITMSEMRKIFAASKKS
ncbi:MAG: IS1634 family transposase [Paludibacteraceae bacterium]|nr:IS1634 family transposase [Paludibacteraceae bacterium]